MPMKKMLSFLVCLLAVAALNAQNRTQVVFSAVGNVNYEMDGLEWTDYDSLVLTNVTKGWTETFRYPDTVIVFNNVMATGIEDYAHTAFHLELGATYDGYSEVVLSLPEAGKMRCELFDVTGRQIAATEKLVASGTHVLSVAMASPQIYFVRVSSPNGTASLKLLGTGNASADAINYSYQRSHEIKEAPKGEVQHPASFGDEFEGRAYKTKFARTQESQEVRFTLENTESQEIEIGFNLCQYLGWTNHNATFTDERDNEEYTYQSYGCQTWMTQNLRYAPQYFLDGVEAGYEDDNDDEWYGYYYAYGLDAETFFVEMDASVLEAIHTEGLLYSWSAVMVANSEGFTPTDGSNRNPSGIQGVCPDGWHVPSDNEWKEFEYYIGLSETEIEEFSPFERGTVAAALAGYQSYWDMGGAMTNMDNIDIWGMYYFNAFPAGYRSTQGDFFERGKATYWWTSTGEIYEETAVTRNLDYDRNRIGRSWQPFSEGQSLRCVQD